MSAPPRASYVALADDWGPTAEPDLWAAQTQGGAILYFGRRIEGGWHAWVQLPAGLWEADVIRSGELPTRTAARIWAEREAARHE